MIILIGTPGPTARSLVRRAGHCAVAAFVLVALGGCSSQDVSSVSDAAAVGTGGAQAPSGVTFQGMSTHFDGLGTPAGACGVPQGVLETSNFVALNVQNTPNNYAGQFTRPIVASMGPEIGAYQNGKNCGRWVRVTMGDFCTAVNDGAPNQPFCHGGSKAPWVSDSYDGATLDMIVTDSCQDNNAWCRDSQYHLDLSTSSLTQFQKNGQPTTDLPNHFGNRKISWQYIAAPNYTGDIQVGFKHAAQHFWPAIVVNRLPNGIHGVESYVNGAWQAATMVGDSGQSFVLAQGTPPFRIRITDASDQLLFNGRVYDVDFPASCGTQCQADYTRATYRVVKP